MVDCLWESAKGGKERGLPASVRMNLSIHLAALVHYRQQRMPMQPSARKAILFAVLAAIVAYVVFDLRGANAPTAPAGTGKLAADSASPASAAQDKHGGLALQERAPLGEERGDLFGAHSWQAPTAEIPGKPAAPVVPPMPYRFAGKLLQDGKTQIYVSKGEFAVPVRQGDTLDGVYRVESIGESRITLLYLPLKHRESILIKSLLPGASQPPDPKARSPVP